MTLYGVESIQDVNGAAQPEVGTFEIMFSKGSRLGGITCICIVPVIDQQANAQLHVVSGTYKVSLSWEAEWHRWPGPVGLPQRNTKK